MNDLSVAELAPTAASGSEDWVAAFFRDADQVSIPKLAAWMAEDIEVRFANAPPIHGKPAAVEAFTGFFGTITGMRHVRESLLLSGADAAQMGKVIYTAPDGRDVSLAVASLLRRTQDGHLDRLWIYIDMAPLYAAAD